MFIKLPRAWRGRPRAAGMSEAASEEPPAGGATPDSLRAAYASVCDAYHKIDDFRAKLLALLPLASGTGILLLLSQDAKSENLIAVGVIGLGATVGLSLYEVRCIRRCRTLINAGMRLEVLLNFPALNPGRDPAPDQDRRLGAFGAPRHPFLLGPATASVIVYSTVIAGWAYLIWLALFRR
jgi:hypothetical protein